MRKKINENQPNPTPKKGIVICLAKHLMREAYYPCHETTTGFISPIPIWQFCTNCLKNKKEKPANPLASSAFNNVAFST